MLIDSPKVYTKAEVLYDGKIRDAIAVGNAARLIKNQKIGRGSVRIGFTNGAFRVLTPTHCVHLSLCRSKCDLLIVGLNTDYSLRLLGRESKFDTQERAFALASLSVVDYVVPFDEETPYLCISSVDPDVVFKGSDYKKEDVISAGKPVEIIQNPINIHVSDIEKAAFKGKYFKV